MNIVRAIIEMGHSLGLTIVADGVETAEQFEFLKDNGCDYMQGYLFSKPIDAEAMTPLLKSAVISPEALRPWQHRES
jgi:EAL domain-containing protein (putative c-di-GMP-specific phosphodiesterase class I)